MNQQNPTLRHPRIGLDARFFLGKSVWPHAALMVELLRHNHQHAHPIQYYLFHHGEIVHQPWMESENVHFVEIPKLLGSDRLTYWLRFPIKIAFSKLDLFFSPFYRFPIIARVMGTPIFHTIYDVSIFTINPSLLPENFRNRWKRLQVWLGFWFTSRIATKTITGSEFSKNEMCQVLRLPGTQVSVVPCCFEPPRKNREFSRPVEGRYLIFVGANMPKKNLDGLLDAWRQLRVRHPDLQLVVRCKMTQAQREWVTQDEWPRLHEFAERIDDFTLQSLIANAVALVLPSYHEGFGLPVMEALAVGTPVCVSEKTAMVEVAADAGVYINPSVTSSIVDGIEDILQLSEEDLEKLKQRCFEQADSYRAVKVIPQLVNLMVVHANQKL